MCFTLSGKTDIVIGFVANEIGEHKLEIFLN